MLARGLRLLAMGPAALILMVMAPQEASAELPVCVACHSATVDQFFTHPHAEQGIRCNVCHGESLRHAESDGGSEPDRIAAPHEVPGLCGACHVGEGPDPILTEYSASQHGMLVLEQSRTRAPHCGTCHGVHQRREGKAIEIRCKRCHATLPAECSELPAPTATVSCAGCHRPHSFLSSPVEVSGDGVCN